MTTAYISLCTKAGAKHFCTSSIIRPGNNKKELFCFEALF